MKSKIIFFSVVAATLVSLASCTVEYRSRHPRPVRQVIVVPVRVGFQTTPAAIIPGMTVLNTGLKLTIVK